MNSSTGKQKVVLVTNIPTPYRIPLFNEIHRQFSERGIGFTVIFAALGYARRKWHIDMGSCRFPYRVLNGATDETTRNPRGLFFYGGLERALAAEQPTLVISNGFSVATTRLYLRRRLGGCPYLIWSGAIEQKNIPDSRLRMIHRRFLVRSARGFIAYGTRAKEYLINLGADCKHVAIAINTVDTTYFMVETERLQRDHASDGTFHRLLYIGNLEPGKRLDLLFKAVASLSRHRQDFILEIVGSGSEREALCKMAAELGIESRLCFLGFLQREQVAQHLARARCFVFPSDYDVWGLVLVEAMAAGLVCLSSIRAGATRDLIIDGTTGFAIDFEDTPATVKRLSWILDHPKETVDIGLRAKHFIQAHVSLEQSAAGFCAAIERSHVLV